MAVQVSERCWDKVEDLPSFHSKDDSLACLTAAGELLTTLCRTIVLPLLAWFEKVTLYPLTSPCDSFFILPDLSPKLGCFKFSPAVLR